MQINILYSKNRFDREKDIFELPFKPGKSIEYYLKKSQIDYNNCDIFANGLKVEDLKEVILFINQPVFEIFLYKKIESAVLEAGHDIVKSTQEVIERLPGGEIFSKVIEPVKFVTSALTKVLKPIAKFADSYLPGNAPINLPNYPVMGALSTASGLAGSGSIEQGSATYSWSGIRTTSSINKVIEVVCGKHRCGGNIINEYISQSGDKSYYNALICYGHGEADSISSIRVNNQPIANFSGITTYERYGTNSQTSIPYFNTVNTTTNINLTLSAGSSITRTTTSDDLDAFEVTFTMPNGLFKQDSRTGELKNTSISILIEYRKDGLGAWTSTTLTATKAKRNSFKLTKRVEGLTTGQYQIRITNQNSAADQYTSDGIIVDFIREIKSTDRTYPGLILLGIRALATEQLSGSAPNITAVIKRKISIPNVLNGATPVDWDDYYYDSATSQYKLFSDDTVLSWDGNTYVDGYSSNPVWIFKDLLLNNEYGLGEYIDSTQVDDSIFVEYSRYAEEKVDDGNSGYEKRYYLDFVLDSPNKALDMFIQLATNFFGLPFYSGGTIGLRIDKPEDSYTQFFGMGNIKKNSFSQDFKSFKEVPNRLTITYNNEDKNYEQDTVTVISESSLEAGDPIIEKNVRLFVTKTSTVVRIARQMLAQDRSIKKSISFTAGCDSIHCQAGDFIAFSHDVPQIGFSGRVQANSTTTLVKLDREVTIQPATTYKILVWFKDGSDTYEEVTVTDGAGTYTEVNVSPAFSQAPAKYDTYAFGVQNINVKPYRIMNIKLNNLLEATVNAIEYDADVYDDTAPILPTDSYSAFTFDIPDVSDLTTTERIQKRPDGTIEDVIDVWFSLPIATDYQLKQYAKARVYFKESGADDYTLAGETTTDRFSIIGGINDLTTYTVVVVSVSSDDEENAITNSPSTTISVIGKAAPPDNVAAFTAIQDGDAVLFSWSANADIDLLGYEIREKNTTWGDSSVVATEIVGTDYRLQMPAFGTKTYYIKAIDTSLNYSNTATSSEVTIDNTPNIDDIGETDLDDWEDGSIELTTQTVYVVDNSGVQVVDNSSVDVVLTEIYGLEIKNTVANENVVDNSGVQVVDNSNTPVIISVTSEDFLELRNLNDGEYVSEGIYYSQAVDLGAKKRARINIIFNAEGDDFYYKIRIRTSDDNVTYSAWSDWGFGEYVCRYYQICFTLGTNDVEKVARLRYLKSRVTVQYYNELYKDQAYSGSGTNTLNLANVYYDRFAVNIQEQGNYYAEITAKTFVAGGASSITYRLRDASTDALTSGTVDIQIRGY